MYGVNYYYPVLKCIVTRVRRIPSKKLMFVSCKYGLIPFRHKDCTQYFVLHPEVHNQYFLKVFWKRKEKKTWNNTNTFKHFRPYFKPYLKKNVTDFNNDEFCATVDFYLSSFPPFLPLRQNNFHLGRVPARLVLNYHTPIHTERTQHLQPNTHLHSRRERETCLADGSGPSTHTNSHRQHLVKYHKERVSEWKNSTIEEKMLYPPPVCGFFWTVATPPHHLPQSLWKTRDVYASDSALHSFSRRFLLLKPLTLPANVMMDFISEHALRAARPDVRHLLTKAPIAWEREGKKSVGT